MLTLYFITYYDEYVNQYELDLHDLYSQIHKNDLTSFTKIFADLKEFFFKIYKTILLYTKKEFFFKILSYYGIKFSFLNFWFYPIQPKKFLKITWTNWRWPRNITLMRSQSVNLTIKPTAVYIFAVFYNALKTLILPVVISLFLCLILLDYYNVNFIRQIAAWGVVGLIFFWLMSGFNFFLKRYRFGKFTAAIQRFWKRTNTYFWLIEGFLFSLFFYYYLNSSQEVYYFFDESNLNQTHLTSLVNGYFSFFFLIIVIFYSFYLMLNTPNFVYKQAVLHLKLISVFLIIIFLLECYQFYYVVTLFFEITWVFNPKLNLWVLDWHSSKIRVKNQYFLLALIAKYWHFLFIFFSWLFFILKSFEQKRIHYTLFGVNLQNCLLLLILNLLFHINWLKWIVRRYYDTIYYWFFTDYNNWFLKNFTLELFNFFSTTLS